MLTDEDVPDPVAEFLAARGYHVLFVRDHFGRETEDHVIARAASQQAALVFTWNQRHFVRLAKRRRKTGALSYPGMSVVAFVCAHPRGLERLELLIEDIEDVYVNRVVERGIRMIAQVDDAVLRFEDPGPSPRPDAQAIITPPPPGLRV